MRPANSRPRCDFCKKPFSILKYIPPVSCSVLFLAIGPESWPWRVQGPRTTSINIKFDHWRRTDWEPNTQTTGSQSVVPWSSKHCGNCSRLFYPLRARSARPGWCNTPTHPPVTGSSISGTQGGGVRAPGHQQMRFCSPVICRSSPHQHYHDLHTLHTQTLTNTPFILTMPPFYTRVDDASPNDIKQRTLHPVTLKCQQQHVSRATTLNILYSFPWTFSQRNNSKPNYLS